MRENSSVSHNKKTADLCREIIIKYEPYKEVIKSTFFHSSLFFLRYIAASHEKKPEEIFNISVEKAEWFSQLDFTYIPALNHSYTVQITYCAQTRQFNKGLQILNEAFEKLPKNTIGHFLFLRSVVMFYLYNEQYNNAIEVVFSTLKHKKFVILSPAQKRYWYLNEAYVNLLLETGHATYEGRRRRFSIQRFINDLPDFSKDKKAMNIPILIAQMIFFITRKQYNNAIDRIESLGKYSSRYLRNDDTFRSMCFIKMLLEIPKWSFNRLRVERATAHLHKRLLASEANLINQPSEVEVIPYEKLWEIVMDTLRADHNYTPKKPRVPIVERQRMRQGQR